MKKYRVILSEEAENDLIRTYEYIYVELANPFGARRTINGILRRCGGLAVFPVGNAVRVARGGIDFRFVHFGNYTIIYYVDDDSVIVHRIIYSRRNISTLFE